MTLIWSTGKNLMDVSTANQHLPYSFSFAYGVDSVKNDINLPVTPPKSFKTIQVPDLDALEKMQKDLYSDTLRIWAGTSSDVENGIYLHLVDARAETLGVSEINLSTENGATSAINRIKAAIDKVSEYRSYFGAVQNRMEHTINNLDNVSENTTSSESRIRDTDMAEEMIAFSKYSILAQTGQSMIAQANQSAQGVLPLLQ